VIPLFLLTFAGLYLSLSAASTGRFSEPLNHTGALYLAITFFSTVGFGDITPQDDLARIATSVQMLLDLVVIGAVVRLLTTAAKSASRPAPDDGTAPPAGEAS
jgi:voltage-gated potassium channel